MAALANVTGIYVTEVFARGIDAIVAFEAISSDIHMVEIGRNPGHCRMAVIAVTTAGNVRWVFAGCDRAVVAGEAGADDLGVVDGVGRRPGDTIVAILADIGGVDMCQVFAGGIGAVMTSDTVARDIGMIEVGGNPRRGRMAIVAGVAAGDVRCMLARCRSSIMAGEAGADDLGVVDGIGRRPK